MNYGKENLEKRKKKDLFQEKYEKEASRGPFF